MASFDTNSGVFW